MRFCYPVPMLRSCLAFLWMVVAGSLPVLGQSVPILSVTFDGNKALDAGRLKSQLKASRDGGWYHPETLKSELKSVENSIRMRVSCGQASGLPQSSSRRFRERARLP